MSNALAIVAQRTGAVVLPDNDHYTNRIQIRSETSDNLYIVSQRKDRNGKAYGEFMCNCRGWIMSQKREGKRTCSHLDGNKKKGTPGIRHILEAAFPSKPSDVKRIG